MILVDRAHCYIFRVGLDMFFSFIA